MDQHFSIVTTSIDSEVNAERLADSIVEAGLAACVQINPIRSIYRWQGRIYREPEYLLVIKTRSTLYEQLETYIKAHHPYELPEIIKVPNVSGSAEYLAWVASSTS